MQPGQVNLRRCPSYSCLVQVLAHRNCTCNHPVTPLTPLAPLAPLVSCRGHPADPTTLSNTCRAVYNRGKKRQTYNKLVSRVQPPTQSLPIPARSTNQDRQGKHHFSISCDTACRFIKVRRNTRVPIIAAFHVIRRVRYPTSHASQSA